jgi:PKD repeat protein
VGHSPAVVARDYGLSPKHTYSRVLNGFAGEISEAARNGLLRDARVLKVERDVEVMLADFEEAESWGLDRIDQRTPLLDGVYEYHQTGAGVTVYVMDTGIRYTHEEFENRARFGFDAYDGNGADCHGHGTHVAGTIGGRTFGVAKAAGLVSVRVIDCDGWGSTSGILGGLEWVAQNHDGPSVVNMSLTSTTSLSFFDDAVENLIRMGVTVVVAAGNFHDDACRYSPARAKNAITVASSGRSDARSSFSNWGPCVDWFAPGEGILSAYHESDTDRASLSGTSMAAPHTAGVAALYLELNPSAAPREVTAALGDWATKGVVLDSNSKSADLLFSLDPSGNDGGTENQPPVAGFSYDCEDLTCRFTDKSTDPDGSIVEWVWAFAELGQSTSQHPTFDFGGSGTYSVSLTVTDDDGRQSSSTESVTVSILPSNQVPQAWFTFVCEELECQFTDESTDPDGSVVAWAWDFGAGLQSTAQNASFTFDEPGAYSVTLQVWDDQDAEDSVSQVVAVTVSPAGISLTATGAKVKGKHVVELSWSGAQGSFVSILRDEQAIGVVPNEGSYTDTPGGRGKGNYVYQVCEEDGTRCSAAVSVTF